MIKITKIKIQEFRGIRNLEIPLNNGSFAVCGPNGTGKSGIVDALEFGLTGNISRLSGKGRGEVSVQEHAPHVDSRNNPEKAIVTITILIPKLSKSAVIERSVSDPKNPIITPSDPDILEVLENVLAHPEFVLSRRELITYVLSTPGDRSKEIQALLKLDKVEDLRATFKRIANSSKKEGALAKLALDQAAHGLKMALGVGALDEKTVLAIVNANRAILNLPAIENITPTTSFKDGLATLKVSVGASRIPKNQAAADAVKLQKMIDQLKDVNFLKLCNELKGELANLNADPVHNQGITRERFLRESLKLIDEDACPVCDTAWNQDELRAVITKKLEKFDEVTKKRIEIEGRLSPIISTLRQVASALLTVRNYNLLPVTSAENNALNRFEAANKINGTTLSNFTSISESIEVLNKIQVIPADLQPALDKIEDTISQLPEPSRQDAARDFLTIGQVNLEGYRIAQFNLKQAENNYRMAARIEEAYVTISTSVLNDIYKQVEKEFVELYEFINREDESGFSAELLPSAGKLGFGVDFYKRGKFPPGAYHSEGHQDSMGFCLYLALMKHMLGESFNLAILDDVLMSVDFGHRREVCAMLKNFFPDTQFILTTHDPIWLNHMQSEGLIPRDSCMSFRKWDVDHGPTDWNEGNIWQEIKDNLDTNNVPGASSLLRRFLEYSFAEVCHKLRAKVEFRSDAKFQLGELFDSAVGIMNKTLQLGIDTAKAWRQEEVAEQIIQKKGALSDLLVKLNYEKWQMNSTIHFNSWDTLNKSDFSPLVDIYMQLLGEFSCRDCGSLLEVVPERGPKKVLKCICGKTSINLAKE